MHHDRQAVHLALKEGEKGVGDTGGHGRQKCHHQREGVGLKAGAEHDKGTRHGKCQRRDLDLGQLFFHKDDGQNGDQIGEVLFRIVTSPCAAWLEA